MQLFGALSLRRWALLGLLSGLGLLGIPSPGSAQYFGRNKVQYDDFEFSVLKTPHFDIHYYPVEEEAVTDAARMAERWYERFARAFQHEFERPKPIILYADHPDFQQTNTLQGSIGEGTGGVTESMKNRVILPMAGSYWDTDHVMGHELIHAFQYNIAQSRRGGGLQGLSMLPLWLIEGMAEYMSVGRDDPLTAMWIRDAIRRDELPTIKQLTTDTKFFPYRFGQALWAYIGGTFGDDAVVQIYRRSLQVGFEGAIKGVLGMPTDTLSIRWKEAVAREYLPLMAGRDAPSMSGDLLLAPSTGAGKQNVSPVISPDGRFMAFLSEKDLFSVDLYVADARTGKVIRKLMSASSDPHVDALRYIDSAGTWSPDGNFFAFVITASGDNEMIIVDAENGNETQRLTFPDIGAVNNPAWSPDGRMIAFSGSVGGITDLFLYDLESSVITQLTDDKNADLQPTWSPDGRTLAFTSDRGPETDFNKLTYSKLQLATLDIATHQVTVIPVFGNVKHMNPQYGPGGKKLYFISDQDGFSDVYDLNLETGQVTRITQLATAVSGITYNSPAMTVASQTGRMVFSVFDALEFHVIGLDPGAGELVAKVDRAQDQLGRKLPPADPDRFSRVATYLADAETGLTPEGTYTGEDAEPYNSGLSLDYVAQPQLGVGTDNFGGFVAGGVAAYFSDMLGDRILGVSVAAQGTLKDVGAQVFYTNMSKRWNWAVGGGRTPYVMGYYQNGAELVDGERKDFLGMYKYRIYTTAANGQVSYPLSTTRRVEFNGGVTRYSYDIELDKYYTYGFNGPFTGETDRVQLDDQEPAPLTLTSAGVALVGDNSAFGFVSPIRGRRYRLEVEQTVGTVGYTTLTADWRRYMSPTKNLAFGLRGMHYGRYGLTYDETQLDGFGLLRPIFVGYQTLVRGYAYQSFNSYECQDGATLIDSCPALNRLFGQRVAVANFEVKVPLIGVEQYGLIDFAFLPTELVLFTDAGVAWDGDHPPSWDFSRSSSARVPVFSTGVSARMNILGFMILEVYYAYPWQRPLKGWHWGFNLAPGW